MPHRFLHGPCEVLLTALATILAAAAGIDDLTSAAIWDKTQFRIFCIVGSLLGAFLAVALFPPREIVGNYSRRLAIKFASSGIAGVLFTPIIIRWRGWPVDVDVVLAVSGAVALVSVSVITACVPLFVKKVTERVGVLGGPPEPPQAL